MISKGIGFSRNLRLPWLDAVAALCGETDDPAEIRSRLEAVIAFDLEGVEARRKTVDVLLGIWFKSGEAAPSLRADALEFYQASIVPSDRLWLHYGLSLVYYPFFRECAAIIGQVSLREGAVTTAAVKRRMAASRGQIAALGRSVRHIVSSLRHWNLLSDAERRHEYVAQHRGLSASDSEIESWLLACALHAHPAEELPFADLVRLPELFPFRLTVTINHLRTSSRFAVQRQGTGWDSVRLTLFEEG